MKTLGLVFAALLVVSYLMAPTGAFAAYEPGQTCEVEWHGQWWPASVVKVKGEFHHIHYTGWEAKWDEWVTVDRMRAAGIIKAAPAGSTDNSSIKVNDKVQVEWGKKWWAAEVLKVENGKYFIHYTGWEARWDEWVTSERIRSTAVAFNPAKPVNAPTKDGAFKVGDKVKVEWGNQWWAAEVQQVGDGKYFIHYTGWDNSWDEWVTSERIRSAADPVGVIDNRIMVTTSGEPLTKTNGEIELLQAELAVRQAQIKEIQIRLKQARARLAEVEKPVVYNK